MREVTTVTEGLARSGKSLSRCAFFLTEEFLPQETGVHFSNYPIYKIAPDGDGETYADRICDYVVKQWGGDRETYLERLLQLDPQAEANWRTDLEQGGSGPWDLLGERDITGWHIAIDEAHTVCGQHHSMRHKKRWMEFLAELGHRGATIEFITQDAAMLAKEVTRHAGSMYSMVNAAKRRDPLFRITMEDWYQLRAKVTGKFVSNVWEVESRKEKGKWVVQRTSTRPLLPQYFRLYDSYDSPKHGGKSATHPPKREWERFGIVAFTLWFLLRNYIAVAIPTVIAATLIYLGPMGGMRAVAGEFFRRLNPSWGERKTPATKLTREQRDEANRLKAREKHARPPTPREPSVPPETTGFAQGPALPNALPLKDPDPVRPAWLMDVVGLTQRTVLLSEGNEIAVGESITEGFSDVVQDVRMFRGRLLVDGVWYDLAEARKARLADPLRSALQGSGAQPLPEAGSLHRPFVVPGSGYATTESLPVSEPADRGVNRVGPGIGPAVGDTGSSGRVGGGSARFAVPTPPR